jgi:probable F420-dependent oxidoreductase
LNLGPVGIWTFQFGSAPNSECNDVAAELEELGYDAIWLPEAVLRDPFVQAAVMLSATKRITLATGIASLYLRSPMAMNAGWQAISEAFPGRFVLGLGVSHAPMVEGLLHQEYGPPVRTMRTYLDAMDEALYLSPASAEQPVRVLAALGPKMLALAGERAHGAHPYNVTPEHTAGARKVLGAGPLLAPEQAVVLESDPGEARRIARQHLSTYLGLPNYTNNLHRLGFTDDDFADGGSDRLVDALVAWGDLDTVSARVRAHHDAGADHVAIQVLPRGQRTDMPLDDWRTLAPVLLA